MVRRAVAAAVIVLSVTACASESPERLPPVDAAVIGAVFEQGDGPPIECRGVPAGHCLEPGRIQDGIGGVALREVDRVIVSCIGTCAADGGAFRIDVVVGDDTREVARGGWGETR